MNKGEKGFTLVEILVSTTLFVSLMALVSISFQRLSAGSEKSLQVLELTAKADAILRYMESDIRNIPNTTPIHLQTNSKPFTLTFMAPVNDTHPRYFHRGNTENSANFFEKRSLRNTDLIWVRWEWGDGLCSRGQSRIDGLHLSAESYIHSETNVKTGATLKTLDLVSSPGSGIQRNGINPTPQRHYEFFEGTGAGINQVSSDGSVLAAPAEKIAVYRIVNNSQFSSSSSTVIDTDDAPWRSGDYRHLYTTVEVGNDSLIPDAYAVRNQDGKTLNKDRLNLLGSDAKDGDGNYIYPSQMRLLYDGMEYTEIQLIGRNGTIIDALSESDRLKDGGNSIDISGVDRCLGIGYGNRPTHMRISYLLHSVDVKERDELDYDGDDDYDESLATAIRDVVDSEGLSTRLEKVHSYRKHAARQGFSSILINQSVKMGY